MRQPGLLKKEMGQPEYSQRTFLWICHAPVLDGGVGTHNTGYETKRIWISGRRHKKAASWWYSDVFTAHAHIYMKFPSQSFASASPRESGYFLLKQARMPFGARNPLTKRKWRPSEDHEERSSDPSTTAPPSRSRPAPVIYPDEITALYSYTIDWRKKMWKESDRATDLLEREADGKPRNEGRRRKEKGEPVIGIGAVEKPWKINYRPCKGVENYIDRRRRRPRRWLAPSATRPRVCQTPLSVVSRDWSFNCDFERGRLLGRASSLWYTIIRERGDELSPEAFDLDGWRVIFSHQRKRIERTLADFNSSRRISRQNFRQTALITSGKCISREKADNISNMYATSLSLSLASRDGNAFEKYS